MSIRLLLFNSVLLSLAASAAPPFTPKDGDRVVFVGNTFIERAQSYGHLEAWLTTAFAEHDLKFRNLGWSGDTVYGDARSYFGPPKEGFERLTKHLEELEPTVIVTCYGAVAAFEGQEGLSHFLEGYGKLLDMFAATDARIVIMSPPPAENLPAPLPKQEAHNERLALYRGALKDLAEKRGHAFADVFTTLRDAWSKLPHPLTDNGIHYTDKGYAAIAPHIAKALGLPEKAFRVEADAKSSATTLESGKLDAITASDRAVTLRLKTESSVPRTLQLKVTGLSEGTYKIRCDRRPAPSATAEELAKGIALSPEVWNPHFKDLQRAIYRKNELFFHRWRPQNETYLFGFRKHEQGNNAVEIPQFEPLIAQQEARIAELKQAPASITLSISR